jgi:hypothetical protein
MPPLFRLLLLGLAACWASSVGATSKVGVDQDIDVPRWDRLVAVESNESQSRLRGFFIKLENKRCLMMVILTDECIVNTAIEVYRNTLIATTLADI